MRTIVEVDWNSNPYQETLALRDRLLRKPLGLSFSDQEIAAEKSQWHFAVWEDQVLIGCLVVVPLGSDHAKIRQMCVEAVQQRKGIGTLLMKEVECELQVRGFHLLELHARESAIGFYQRLGWEVEGEEFLEVSLPHFKMVKQLAVSS